MSEKQSSTTSGGIGVSGLLGILFVAFKLLGIINWSWWWVTAPFWGGLAIVLAICLIIALAVGIALLFAAAIDAYSARRREAARRS